MSENKCCGNCKYFKNEDVNGEGFCTIKDDFESSLYDCPNHEFRNNGWAEITPDNIEYIKNNERRIVIANSHHGSTFYRTIHDVNGVDAMAKQGGYYYYVLPELKIE